MALKLTVNQCSPPTDALIVAEVVNAESSKKVDIEWYKDEKAPNSVKLLDKGGKLLGETSHEIGRYIARTINADLYGGNGAQENTQVDHWLSFAIGPLKSKTIKDDSLVYLNRILTTNTWLVAKKLTLADICVFCALADRKFLQEYGKSYSSISRWYKQMLAIPAVEKALELHAKNAINRPDNVRAENGGNQQKAGKKEDGKFIELPGAEMGKVVVRFPPEASGYLHIGHAKAALLNQYYADAFEGELIMRFDDTNPAKENVEFERAILEDLKLLQIRPHRFTHSSDYFDLMLEYCTKLIEEGKAFVDDSPAQVMKEQREQMLMSSNRNNSVQKNMELWNEMKKGTAKGQECCVRAKIDYQSANGCLRDPTIYRCKPEPHPRTGTKYKVYPTYDFACPIVDAVEGVTHTLRTTEYHDRDAQFYWLIDALGLRCPHIWEYSRLNMTNTVLSKRKLTWFVAENLVDGWDDPRFPTVRGILRRGMTVEGLKQFIVAQGSSRSVVFMEWDKIWAFNKKIIDPVATRYTALTSKDTVLVNVRDAKEQWLSVQNHPKDPALGVKEIKVGPKILIEKCDAEVLKEGENTTFINWGNLFIEKIERKGSEISGIVARLNLEDKNYKKTLKLTWIALPSDQNDERDHFVPCYAVYFDHIISKPVLAKDDDFKDYVAKNTRWEVEMIGEPELRRVKKGEIIQLQRKGFFRCDVPYAPTSPLSSREQPIVLFHIPDGHTTSSTAVPKATGQETVEKALPQTAETLNQKIADQGDLVRKLKTEKADKAAIDAQVQVLLSLKKEYKAVTGTDWKPGTPNVQKTEGVNADTLNKKIIAQGDKVRQLKSEKADKATIDAEVKALLALKNEYKTVVGSDWKPGAQSVKESKGESGETLDKKIVAQGDKVRQLKSEKADKATIDAEVKALLALKNEYKTVVGSDWKPGAQNVKESKGESGETLDKKIVAQGDKVRQLKSEKADKATIDTEVKALLALKNEYKTVVGSDWKPGAQNVKESKGESEETLDKKIVAQGDKVRQLKSQKADKATVDAEVKVLLALKNEYKAVVGADWKPKAQKNDAEAKPSKKVEVVKPNAQAKPAEVLSEKIVEQDRKLKELQAAIELEMKQLANLKMEYKGATGEDWQLNKGQQSTNTSDETSAAAISEKIQKQGDKVRELKSAKADKETIDKEVKTLLKLKDDYKGATGEDWKPKADPGAADAKKKKGKKAEDSKNKGNEVAKVEAQKDVEKSKTGTRLGLEVKKEENFFEWYSQVITKAGMIEYYDVSGCYILRPWSYGIWKIIKSYIDDHITKMGVQECYFPIFVTRAVLEKEKTHIADFAPEVAWVTKCGDSNLAEPIAIRPTSETVMYPAYAKWLRSDTELPLRLNQWNNVVRWEFKDPKPFLRTREFLWQEGHTAFATKAEADEEVLIILDMYARVYEHLLAVPVIKGRKTEKEKFAGGDYTTTVEAFISTSGRAIQGATSHHLGQNFSKMFNIQVEGVTGTEEKSFVYQNSWGLTTRTIGVMIMVHGDDKGLVLPPNVAAVQAVLIPCGITASTSAAQRENLMEECNKLLSELSSDGQVRIKADLRNNRTPGWKFNHWELKGVPVRVELGPKDLEKNQVTFVRRDNAERITAARSQALASLEKLLADVQSSMFERAKSKLNNHVKQAEKWDDFYSELNKKNLLLSPFCGEPSCEDNIKADSAREDAGEELGALSMGAKSLCIPFDQPSVAIDSLKCIHPKCKNKPKFYTLFGRSY